MSLLSKWVGIRTETVKREQSVELSLNSRALFKSFTNKLELLSGVRGSSMAKIRDDCLELQLTPRRYQEAEDDPFISTMFELLEPNKVIARDYSAALLESEYKMLISGIEALLAGKQDRIRLETIEPFFILSIDKENEYS